MTNTSNNEHYQAVLQSYETSYNVHQFVKNRTINRSLKTIFGIAAGTVTAFNTESLFLPLLILNGAFIYDMWKSRQDNVTLAHIFNQESANLSEDARSHLRPITKEIEKIKPLGFHDLDLVKQAKENTFAFVYTAISTFLAPQILPALLAITIVTNDKKIDHNLITKAKEIKKEMEQLYPDLKNV